MFLILTVHGLLMYRVLGVHISQLCHISVIIRYIYIYIYVCVCVCVCVNV
jgi:hypothetical protein